MIRELSSGRELLSSVTSSDVVRLITRTRCCDDARLLTLMLDSYCLLQSGLAAALAGDASRTPGLAAHCSYKVLICSSLVGYLRAVFLTFDDSTLSVDQAFSDY